MTEETVWASRSASSPSRSAFSDQSTNCASVISWWRYAAILSATVCFVIVMIALTTCLLALAEHPASRLGTRQSLHASHFGRVRAGAPPSASHSISRQRRTTSVGPPSRPPWPRTRAVDGRHHPAVESSACSCCLLHQF